MVVVLLLELDSNKYQTILAFKKYMAGHPDIRPKERSTERLIESDYRIDEFGETAAIKVRHPQKRLAPEEIQALIAEYKSGKEPTELGKEFGIHRITVSKILKRNGIPLRRTCARQMKTPF